jgi:hypothetical protein
VPSLHSQSGPAGQLPLPEDQHPGAMVNNTSAKPASPIACRLPDFPNIGAAS